MVSMKEREAFAAMFRAYDRRVYFTAYRFIGSREEAADITQEVFLRAWKNFSRIDPERPVFPWLFRITKNLCINKSRKKSGSEAGLEFPELAPARESVETEVLERESQGEIRRAVMQLPEKFREIIILKHYDECSYDEMAEILDIPKGTVMSRLFNARKILKQNIDL